MIIFGIYHQCWSESTTSTPAMDSFEVHSSGILPFFSTRDLLFNAYLGSLFHVRHPYWKIKQVKPGFTNYQPQPKYSWALSKIEGKGKLGKTKDLWKRSEKLNNSENVKIWNILKIWPGTAEISAGGLLEPLLLEPMEPLELVESMEPFWAGRPWT